MEKVYQNIKKFRTEQGMTQREFAEKCGYKDHAIITRIEGGKIDASIGTLRKMANALGVSLYDLLGLEDEQ